MFSLEFKRILLCIPPIPYQRYVSNTCRLSLVETQGKIKLIREYQDKSRGSQFLKDTKYIEI